MKPSPAFPARPSSRRRTPPSIETLESRIAPAQFFVSATAVSVKNSAGQEVNDTASAATAGANLAVLLKKGDSLVLDANDNHKLDKGELVFATVAGGSGLFFGRDLDASGGVSKDEITGVAVSDRFSGRINGDINGSVATMLDATGALTLGTVQQASITGLTVTGRVAQHILAGGDIQNVRIQSALPSDAGKPAVDTLASGTGADQASFNFGGTTDSVASYALSAGVGGGSIKNVYLNHGARSVVAGGGASSATGSGAAGGSIVNLTLANVVEPANIAAGAGGNAVGQTGNGGNGGAIVNGTILSGLAEFQLAAGDGGASSAVGGRGGNGGSVVNPKISATASALPPQSFTTNVFAGAGGVGDLGGSGGSVSHLTFTSTVSIDHEIFVVGGNGGQGRNALATEEGCDGGNGGSILGARISSIASVDFVGFYGGRGGDAGLDTNGRGGNGGHVSSVTYKVAGGEYPASIGGGDGGAGSGSGDGGRGGDVLNVTAAFGGVDLDSQIYSGAGGDAVDGRGGNSGNVRNVRIASDTIAGSSLFLVSKPGVSEHGNPGASGSLSGFSFSAAVLKGAVSIFSSQGSNGASGAASGALQNVKVSVGMAMPGSEISVYSGSGGSGALGDGGNSGALKNVSVTVNAGSLNGLWVGSGDGGANYAGIGKGGDSGGVSNLTIKTGASIQTLDVYSGSGGASTGDLGYAGSSGALANVRATAFATVAAAFFTTGDGGAAPVPMGLGGDSGSMSNISLHLPAGALDAVSIWTGNGGDSAAPAGYGGNAGSIAGLQVAAPGSVVSINMTGSDRATPHAGTGGSDDLSLGGLGGDVKNVRVQAASLAIAAPDGGASGGKGGHGGSISGLISVNADQIVEIIRAGDGGNGGTDGGLGGSVVGVAVKGDIGVFGKAFGFASGQSGGLAVGKAGTSAGADHPERNGSALAISAKRIAAIVAGTPAPDALTAANAAAKIAVRKGAQAIGTDQSPAGFDFIDAGAAGFHLGEGDAAQDGLVIVLKGKYSGPIAPLQLVEVAPL